MSGQSSGKPHINRDHLLALLTGMVRVRRFEEKCAELYTREKIRGFLHLYIGEEAVAVGINQALRPEDALISTYREHGHALARGIAMGPVMAEMYGKVSGCSHGRGGSMHLFDAEHRFYGGNAIVAGGLPLAVGLALADRMRGQNRVTACFFGEGAAAEGEFHESLNLAALWKLPILFVCENNLYAMGTALELSESEKHIYLKARSYGIEAWPVDGMNVVDVEAAATKACDAIREGGGPRFLECKTYRFRGHSMFDTQLYREKEEIERWQKQGPIVRLQDWMQANRLLHEGDLPGIEKIVDAEVEEAVAFAESAAFEPESELGTNVYTPRVDA
ncbi:pyruvate dehydrogenase (acetyl-transferring) E1 component subunit alpha [Marinobacterium aestuariivivens]|uniref:Pyruvate dehydrogenase E1 component subunit alpha n=1 Tax=Marinobacterium aestuariivivens TaxID=1698799 RepID=A0ABW1ZYC2_9GAMM